jgi:hypothetical protein
MGDETVVLLVGLEEMKYTVSTRKASSSSMCTPFHFPIEIRTGNPKVHKKVLCDRCPFSAGAFTTSFVEGQEITLRLPEDDPEAVYTLVDFLYPGVVAEIPLAGADQGDGYVNTMMSSYVLGEKICLNEFMNRIIDKFGTLLARDLVLIGSSAKKIYQTTHDDSRLRRYLVLETANVMLGGPTQPFIASNACV